VIRDLASEERDVFLATDVLVVGGGIAGLLLAAKLRDHKCQTVVIESGGREQREETHPLNRVIQLGNPYRGAMHGRFRCLGGTSTRWGGALIPFLSEDFFARSYLGVPAWPVEIDAALPYLSEVEALFGVDHGSYQEAFIKSFKHPTSVPTEDEDFIARFAKWPAFTRRNVANLLKGRINSDRGLDVWINATASSFDLDRETGRLRSITARYSNNRMLTIGAKYIILCAGAIETTRLLLLMDAQYDNRLFENCQALGRYFYDHISTPAASIHARDARMLNRLAGVRFSQSTTRSLRFELRPAAQRRESAPSAFGHISFESKVPSGFDALREFLRALQRSGRFDRKIAMRVVGDLPYMSKAATWRFIHNQLYWPIPADYALHVVAEQLPRYENRISLASEKDLFGLPLAAIDWRVSSNDTRIFRIYRQNFERFWAKHKLNAIGDLEWLISGDSEGTEVIPLGSDVYHPGGSTRMGSDSRSAVVNSDLKTFSVQNLWISSTSVFPSGASANPTLMLMLFTRRLADHLAHNLRSK